ncbi:hypothetical protein Tco_0620314 [Tanacetum coccineum]
MSIYDFMTLPSWSDAKIAKESHHLSLLLLERVPSHTTTPATEGAIIPLHTPDEISASLLDSRLVKKSKGTDKADLADLCDEIEDSLERDEGVSMRAVSAPISRLGNRLCAPPSIAVVSASEPSHVGTSAPASTSGVVASGCVGKSEAEVMRYDDFGTATHGEEIDLTLFPLAPGPYHMPYPYEGVSSPLYTKEEWNGPHSPKLSILCKDILNDQNEFLNRVNVLSALLVSYGYELNSCYANLVSSKAHLQEKLNKKKGYRDAAFEEVKKLQSQLTDAKTTSASLSEELTQTDAKLSKQALTDAMDGLRDEVTQFVGYGVESIIQKLLSSDEFHAALARVASLGINYGVERGLCMGRTDVEFEAAIQKVSNFHAGAMANFHKALVDFPTKPFPFLSRIAAAFEGTLSDVAQILPDKFVRSATLVFVAPSNVNEAPEQVPH